VAVGLVELAEAGLGAGELGQCVRHAPADELADDVERLPVQLPGAFQVAAGAGDRPQCVPRVRDPAPPPGSAGDGRCLGEQGDRPLLVALDRDEAAEVGQGGDQQPLRALGAGGRDRLFVAAYRLRDVAAALGQLGQHPERVGLGPRVVECLELLQRVAPNLLGPQGRALVVADEGDRVHGGVRLAPGVAGGREVGLGLRGQRYHVGAGPAGLPPHLGDENLGGRRVDRVAKVLEQLEGATGGTDPLV
jgi:hypothetical protein